MEYTSARPRLRSRNSTISPCNQSINNMHGTIQSKRCISFILPPRVIDRFGEKYDYLLRKNANLEGKRWKKGEIFTVLRYGYVKQLELITYIVVRKHWGSRKNIILEKRVEAKISFFGGGEGICTPDSINQ